MSLRVSLSESGIRLSHAEFKVKVTDLTSETLTSLAEIWQSAGYEETECKGLLGDLFAKFKKMCNAEIGIINF
jgi:NADH:ubiquinone oxidoreductase subunit C